VTGASSTKTNAMKHTKDCAWEKADCEYKATHHYCPHPEHACTCQPKKPLSERLEEMGFKPVHSISVTNLTLERLARNPVVYTVTFRHDEEGMSFTVHDVQDSPHDRKSVAADFEAAAKSLCDTAG